MTTEAVRFTDVLTTASAVANYLSATEVTPGHMLDAIGILDGSKTMEELGRAVSPLVPRPRGGPTATASVRDLAQRWFAHLGGDPMAVVEEAQLERLRNEIAALG